MNKVAWNVPLWDMHDGIPKSVPVITPEGRMVDVPYIVMCEFSCSVSPDMDVLDDLRGGAISTNKMVYPIAQTAEGFIVAAYEYDGTRFGMLILNISGLPVFEQRGDEIPMLGDQHKR